MKFAKRLSALLLCVVMLVSACVINVSAAASVTVTKTNGRNITSGGEVVWTEYSVYGGNTKHTEEVNILQFNPNDGYLPLVFQRNAGSVNKLSSEYTGATTKYGYEVAGIINGSYFDLANSTLVGTIISNGRIMCAHNDYSDSMVTFDSNGKMNVVDSKLEYKLYIKGQEFTKAIRFINKRFEIDGYKSGLFYYYDTSCGATADSASTGYEIVCKKVNNSDLMVGKTLFAEVVEVRKDQGPTKFDTVDQESEKFVLYCESTSPYVPYIKDLKAGDSIAISTNETIAASKEVMENANSAITNVGWLVKDGEDMTATQATIGSHNVNATYARWTAFGTKPDGTYVFMTSDGGSTGTTSRSLSLREVAAFMIKQGCTNVIRMDHGGSTAMYTSNSDGNNNPGYLYVSGDRAVADCIMIVKKTSMEDKDITADLNTAITNAKKVVVTTPNASLSAIITEAEALVAKGTVIESDARRMIFRLSGKDELQTLINKASSVSYKDYGETVLTELRANYKQALDVYCKSNATADEIGKATDALSKNLSSSGYINLSQGKSYTTTATNRTDKFDDDKVKLTDGAKSEKTGKDVNSYSGWAPAPESVDITVDLGSVVNSNSFTVYGAYNYWGIEPLKELKISVSTNGTTFTEVGSTTTVVSEGTGDVDEYETVQLISLNVVTDTVQSARFIRFTIHPTNYVWIDEVEVGLSSVAIDKAVEIHGFNQFLYDSNCFIYTPDYVTASGINNRYATNVILEATDDPDVWTIVSVQKCNGSAPDVTLKSNQIMIACHKGATTASGVSETLLLNSRPGDTLELYGINVEEKNIGIAAYALVKHIHTPGAAADCVNDQICTVCGELLDSAKGHTAGPAADCVNDQTCITCGAVLDISKGHNYNEKVTAPTCTEQGYTTYTCSKCGDSYKDDFIEANGHSTNGATDCDTAEVCSVCGITVEAAKGHNYNEKVTAPTCTEQGYTTHTCETCGDSYKDTFVRANGHSKSESADCEKDQICTTCGDVLVPAWGHNYQAVVTAPTCTERGYTTHTCVNCLDSYINTYVAAGHTEGEAATCTKDQTCTVCGEVINAAKGHTAGPVADCTNDQICTVCGELLDSAKGHTAGPVADCTNDQICTTCGDVIEKANGHNGEWKTLEDGSHEKHCVNCGTILDRIPTNTPEEKPDDTPENSLGDVNNDGKVDQYDYILVKRYHFNTVSLSDTQQACADVNGDGDVNQYDYILIKRHHFGTYTIK